MDQVAAAAGERAVLAELRAIGLSLAPVPPPPPPRAFSGGSKLKRRTAYKEKKRKVEGATLSTTTQKARACRAGPASD